eukprot:764773-Pyramimonas_sp.AAC.1
MCESAPRVGLNTRITPVRVDPYPSGATASPTLRLSPARDSPFRVDADSLSSPRSQNRQAQRRAPHHGEAGLHSRPGGLH